MYDMYIYWLGSRATCTLSDPRTKLFLEATVWLDWVIDIMHPVDKCYLYHLAWKRKFSYLWIKERMITVLRKCFIRVKLKHDDAKRKLTNTMPWWNNHVIYKNIQQRYLFKNIWDCSVFLNFWIRNPQGCRT